MVVPNILVVLSGVTSLIGMSLILYYFFVQHANRVKESSIISTIKGEGILRPDLVLQILKEYKSDDSRLSALEKILEHEQRRSDAAQLYEKIKSEIDLTQFSKEQNRSKRKSLLILGIVLLLLSIIVLVQSYWTSNVITSKESPVLLVSNWTGYVPFFIAHEKGLMENWDLVVGTHESRKVRRDLIHGTSIGAYVGTIDETVIEIEKQAQYSLEPSYILTLAQSNGGDAIVGDSNIVNLKSLNGKKIGAWAGGTAYYLLLYKLKEIGLTLDSIEFVHIEKPEDLISEFEKGNLDAIATWSPWLEKASEFGEIIAQGSGNFGPPSIFDILFVSNTEVTNEYNSEFKELFAAWNAGVDIVRNPTDDDLESIARWMEVDVNEVQIMLDRVIYYSVLENFSQINSWNELVLQVETECKYAGCSPKFDKSKINIYPALARDFLDGN